MYSQDVRNNLKALFRYSKIIAIGTSNQAGATFSSVAQSFAAGFITGSVAVTAGILTGGVPAAGALGLSLTGLGAISGVAADLGLTALLAPYTVTTSDASKGISSKVNL